MAYDEQLAERIRESLAGEPGVAERLMFGGIAFMLNGNMTAGVIKDDLMVRVGADAYEDVLDLPHARVMDFNGRPLKGMVFVDKEGFVCDADLSAWLEYGLTFARSLPAK